MPSRVPRRALLVIILAALVIVVVSLFAMRRRGAPVAVSTTHAKRGALSSWVSSNGKVEPIQPYVLQSELTTSIQNVAVQAGEKVRLGQILMTLQAMDFESDLSRARADLVAAEQAQKVAASGGAADERAELDTQIAKTTADTTRLRRELESLERLYARQAATRQEVDQAKAALESAEADNRLLQQKKAAMASRTKVEAEHAALEADQARQAISAIQQKMRSARVSAPVQGTVYSVPVRSGAFVHTGDVLAEMADLTRIRVRAFVDEPELGLLRQGQLVEITWDGLPNRMWTGQVEQLPNTIVARGSRNVGEVLCSVAADSALLPNTNVDVRIRTAENGNSLTLDRSAIRTDANQHYVFVVEDGRLRRRNVTIGLSNSTEYEILSGITESDVVALPGSSDFREGMPVTVS